MIPTDFSQLIGHSAVKNYLAHMLQQQAVGHALLLAGPDGVGKSLFAYALAAQLLTRQEEDHPQLAKIKKGIHPDIHIYRPEGKLALHSIQSLRQLSDEVQMPPYEAQWKVFIIQEADRMLTYSANALLKTFEEPPPRTLIILVSSAPASLLPTIISRCRTINFQAISDQEIVAYLKNRFELEEHQAVLTARLAQGSLGQAVALVEKGGDTLRQAVLNLLGRTEFKTYKDLSQMAQQLADQVESVKKQIQEAAKAELYKTPADELSAHLQHVLEKELEGIVAMQGVQEANRLFQSILSWYRDLHLLRLNGPAAYLMNPDYAVELESVLQRGNILSIESVQKAIKECQLVLQRSTALHLCLENLFLKLDLLQVAEVLE